ncbi:hypothetical protein ACH4OW_28420 [Streptomyces sp. NPDC017056]|uniref:hypothetical protein n=1 Tax=Streptomyces sp. NPDC017056 TaxID=3364973 RepID=UPI0037A71C10
MTSHLPSGWTIEQIRTLSQDRSATPLSLDRLVVVEEPGQGTGTRLGEPNQGTGTRLGEPDQGTGTPLREPGQGTGTRLREPGQGTGTRLREPGRGTGTRLREPGQGTGTPLREPGQGTSTPLREPGQGTGTRLRPEVILGFHDLCLVLHDGEWFMGQLCTDGSITCWASYGPDLAGAIRGL